MADDAGRLIRVADDPDDADSDELVTITIVAEASRLPQPVIAQWVPRTWSDADGGWMYTRAQLLEAVRIAERMRREHAGQPRPQLKVVGGQA